ncbi:hypothetical protein GF402_09640 [Candidatus Fermentibacteria bacterium]|nr:hypothetical protein [Candidatus Fermentibacteria bacterium]
MGLAESLQSIDREVCGLLDAYLEAVPECPPREDTPIRLWQLDMAWLRVNSVLAEQLPSIRAPGRGDIDSLCAEYRTACVRLVDHYQSIMQAYHADVLPDSISAVELEIGLLELDSSYILVENQLCRLIAEAEEGQE